MVKSGGGGQRLRIFMGKTSLERVTWEMENDVEYSSINMDHGEINYHDWNMMKLT
jgi:hypothetical protein